MYPHTPSTSLRPCPFVSVIPGPSRGEESCLNTNVLMSHPWARNNERDESTGRSASHASTIFFAYVAQAWYVDSPEKAVSYRLPPVEPEIHSKDLSSTGNRKRDGILP